MADPQQKRRDGHNQPRRGWDLLRGDHLHRARTPRADDARQHRPGPVDDPRERNDALPLGANARRATAPHGRNSGESSFLLVPSGSGALFAGTRRAGAAS
jgi:hypothetical protein